MKLDKPSTRTEKVSTVEEIQEEMSELVRCLAAPSMPGESVKTCIRRASVRSGLPFNQVKRAWYREWRSIPAYIADNIRAKAAAHDRKLKTAMYQSIVAMQKVDPDYFCEQLESISDVLFQGRD